MTLSSTLKRWKQQHVTNRLYIDHQKSWQQNYHITSEITNKVKTAPRDHVQDVGSTSWTWSLGAVFNHGQKGATDRPTHCPAWGAICHNCQIPNLFARLRNHAISIVQAINDQMINVAFVTLPAKISSNNL